MSGEETPHARQAPSARPAVSAEELFAGTDITRKVLRAVDWDATSLGPVRSWPGELLAAIRTVLPSEIPMLLWWGPDLIQIFNDAYRVMLGDKFPAAAGQPAAQCWAEIWDEVGAMAEYALSGLGATYAENQQLFMRRRGFLEETYWTFSYSPVTGHGGVAGVFVATTEVTARVVGDRRLETLRRLGALSSTEVGAAADVCRLAVQVLADSSHDFPMVMAYLLPEGMLASGADQGEADGAGPTAPIVSTGATPTGAAADRLRAQVGQVMRVGERAQVTGLAPPPAAPPDGARAGAPADKACVLPLRLRGRERPIGALVVGTSPYLDVDESYWTFLTLTADRVSTAITDCLAYQEQRGRAAALADLNAAKSMFFANVSHELRTPLTLIAGPVLDMLADDHEPLAAAHRQRLEIVDRNTARLQRLVDDLLDIVRIEDGKIEAERVPTDLPELTRGIASSFEFVMQQAGLRFVVQVDPLPHTAHVDPEMWEKIVTNLLSNAVKFTLDGEVRLHLHGTGDRVVLSVTDTGVGIPADELPLLFQRFHRVRGTAGRSHEGAGIGLSLVREMATRHGGAVTAAPAPGRGTTFTVELPYGASDRQDAPVITQPVGRPQPRHLARRWDEGDPLPPQAGPAGERALVLVVDDNADLRTYVAALLAPYYRVVTASDGRDALDRIDAAPPDLVLADVMMPGMDGLALVRALRTDQRTATVPLILLSARAGERPTVEGLRTGADDYLVKPFSSQELLARVRSHLDLARLRGQQLAWRTTIMNSLQEALVVVDADGVLLEVNDAFRRLVGFPVTQLPLAPPHPWWPDPQHDPARRIVLETAIDQCPGVPGSNVILPLRNADGHPIQARALFSSLRDPETGDLVYVGTLRDVTAELAAARRQAILARLTGRLADATTVDEVLGAGLDELQALLGRGRAAALSFDPAGEPSAMAGYPPPTSRERRSLARLRHTARPHAEHDRAGGLVTLGVMLDSGDPAIALLLSPDHPPAPPDVDMSTLITMSDVLSHALRRAQSYDSHRTVALTLQRSILGPADLPAGFAVRYEPALSPLKVGGDWYDVVPLGGEAIGVVVGDCVGRGLPAAAVMGQLRSACRALLLQAKGPGEVLSALDDFAAMLPGAACTTVFCAIIDTATATMRYSCAGHPPGILVGVDGGGQLLDRAGSVPLASLPVSGRPEATVSLQAASTLLLYTDGLVERRERGIDDGIALAMQAVSDGRALGEERLADAVMAAMLAGGGHNDDVAVLVYQHSSPVRLDLDIAADPALLSGMRADLRRWLSEARVSEADTDVVMIAATEACANAIEHGYRFDRTRSVRLSAALTAGRLELTIADTGGWRTPTTARTNRGRGRMIMEKLMDSTLVEGAPEGTTVRLAKDVSHVC